MIFITALVDELCRCFASKISFLYLRALSKAPTTEWLRQPNATAQMFASLSRWASQFASYIISYFLK